MTTRRYTYYTIYNNFSSDFVKIFKKINKSLNFDSKKADFYGKNIKKQSPDFKIQALVILTKNMH